MSRENYLEQHHYITEKWIGIARLRLEQGDPNAAKEALDRCLADLKAVRPVGAGEQPSEESASSPLNLADMNEMDAKHPGWDQE